MEEKMAWIHLNRGDFKDEENWFRKIIDLQFPMELRPNETVDFVSLEVSEVTVHTTESIKEKKK